MQNFMYKLPHGTIDGLIIDDHITGKDGKNLMLDVWNICLNKYQQHQVYLHFFIDDVLERQDEELGKAMENDMEIYFKNSFTGKLYVKEDADKQDEVTRDFIASFEVLQRNCPAAATLLLHDIEMANRYDLLKAISTTSKEAICKHLLNMLWEADHYMEYLESSPKLCKAHEGWEKMQAALTCYLNEADLSKDI